MEREKFRDWLLGKDLNAKVISDHLSRVARIETLIVAHKDKLVKDVNVNTEILQKICIPSKCDIFETMGG